MSRTSLVAIAFATTAVFLSVPTLMFAQGVDAARVAAYGAWVSNIVLAIAGIFAVSQLALTKDASEADAFLKICDMVDDGRFRDSFKLVHDNRTLFHNSRAADEGLDSLRDVPNFDALNQAAWDVLFSLEKVGILVHHAVVNTEMIAEYIGEKVTYAVDDLSDIIAYEQKRDSELYERLLELRAICRKHGWTDIRYETTLASAARR